MTDQTTPKNCVLHPYFEGRLKDVESTQRLRKCDQHEAKLDNHTKDIRDLEIMDGDIWTAINQLRKVVWGWAPIMSLLGSIVGGVITAVVIYRLLGK